MRLLPGVRYENTVDSLGMSFGTDVPNVGGARRDWSNVIVDGVVANEVGNSGLMAQQINLDAIAEVRVLLNSYRAEYGRAGGGQVQIVSKSGGANYRGNLYYYGRHESLNANDFFRNRQGVKKPRYRFNTYGANLGGPVPKAKEALLLLLAGSAAGEPPRSAAQLDDADRRRDARRLLADPGRQGRLIFIRDPQREGACNAVTGGRGVLPRQHHPGQPHQLERLRAAEHAAAGDQLRPHLHPGPVQSLDAGERREPEDEQHRPGGLAADGQRQLLLHVQGLVLGPARQRDHRRPGEVGLLQHPLPEHRPRRQRELHQDPPPEPGPRHRLRHPPADRAVLSADRGRLGPHQPRATSASRSASSTRS